MAIIKNKPLFEFKEGDWAKPRHIIIEGTDEEIGYDLGTLAKNDYGTELCPWVSPEYGIAKRKYLEKNFPSFAERSKGVCVVPLDFLPTTSNSILRCYLTIFTT